MKSMLKKLSSFDLPVVLLAILVILLAAATFIEKYLGTQAAMEHVYHSPLLFILMIFLVVAFFLYAGRNGYLTRKRIGLVTAHLSFVLILAGAAVTHFFSVEGVLYLREGEMSDTMLVRGRDDDASSHRLPFSIYLDDFILTRYPGSGSPSSYESQVTVKAEGEEFKARIYMNNVLDIKGYRLYQASYDQDEKGSILSVNYDSAGRFITYSGYFLLFIGLVLSLVGRHGRFRQLYRRLDSIRTGSALLVALLLAVSAQASESGSTDAVLKYEISREHAALFGGLAVQSSDGRMKPVNTFSSEVLRKVYREETFHGMDSDQFLLSLMLMPDLWADVPVISVKDKELASRYGLGSPYASYMQMFDQSGNYKLQDELDRISRKDPSLRTKTDKEALKIDERVNIFHLLASHRMLNIFPMPEDEAHSWYAPGDDHSVFVGRDSMFVSQIFDWYMEEVATAVISGDWTKADEVAGMIGTYQQAKACGVDVSRRKMETEVLYNRLDIFRSCRMAYLILGTLSLLFAVAGVFGFARARWIGWMLVALVSTAFAMHVAGLGMRWFIGGYAPWTNSYETMVYVSFATVLAGLLFVRRNMLVFSLAVLFGGVILFVSGMNWMDPQITTLVPVLKSPWLMFHVAVIVAAYGFLGLSCLIGLANLIFMIIAPFSSVSRNISARIKEMTLLNEMSLWIGLVLLTIGTFLGAVWANESWGRYWGWDPKETWALVTILVYVMVTHVHLLKTRHQDWLFNFLSVIAFSSVLMTFLGVNYFLTGMHSYGQSDQAADSFIWIAFTIVFVLIVGIVSLTASRKRQWCKK